MRLAQERIIGIDLGERRVGVAISDEMGLYAHPLKTLKYLDNERLAADLIELAARNEALSFVVGLPKNMDGSMGLGALKAMEFAQTLRKKSGFPVALCDERLTTSQAEKEMIGLGKSRKRRRRAIDAAAAVLILENYLRKRAAKPLEDERL